MKELNGLNLKELKAIAKERGLNSKDAIKHGPVQGRTAWVKLLNQNPGRKQKQSDTDISITDYKPSKSVVSKVRGLTRLPEIKTIVYFYGGAKS